METIEYLRAAKEQTATGSDYALAKALGITQQAVSNYMNGKRTIDASTALRLAILLKIDPAVIIAQASLERSTEKDRTLWSTYVRKLIELSKEAGTGDNMKLTPTPPQAAPALDSNRANTVHYVKSKIAEAVKEAISSVLEMHKSHVLRVHC